MHRRLNLDDCAKTWKKHSGCGSGIANPLQKKGGVLEIGLPYQGAGRSRSLPARPVSLQKRTKRFLCLFLVCLHATTVLEWPNSYCYSSRTSCPQWLLWAQFESASGDSALVPSFMLVANADGARNACFLPSTTRGTSAGDRISALPESVRFVVRPNRYDARSEWSVASGIAIGSDARGLLERAPGVSRGDLSKFVLHQP